MRVIAVLCALLAAAGNALASVLQRRAARTAPREEAFRPSLVGDLVRRPVWLGGVAALIGGFVCQAAALSIAGLALVQPLLIAELPFTMLLLARVLHVRLDRRTWLAVVVMTVGIAGFLAAAAPAIGHRSPDRWDWMIAAIVTIGLIAGLVLVSVTISSAARAALLGTATGIGFAFTATFIKATTGLLSQGFTALFTSWPLYAMVGAGLCSLFLLQNALQSGTLVAAQPALTISDPVASVSYGVIMFGETVRTGPWIIPEVAGMGFIAYGSVRLSRSPLIHDRKEMR